MQISYLINAFFIYKLLVQILCQYLHAWNLTKPSVNLALEFNFSIRNCTTCTCTQYNLLFGQERGYKKKLLAPSWFQGAKQRTRAKACNSVEFVDTLIWGDRLSKVQFTIAHFQESFVMLWIDTNGQFALFSS